MNCSAATPCSHEQKKKGKSKKETFHIALNNLGIEIRNIPYSIRDDGLVLMDLHGNLCTNLKGEEMFAPYMTFWKDDRRIWRAMKKQLRKDLQLA